MDIGSQTNVEERLLSLEREANFWRVKFEELDKWRENLEDWVLANFGFHIRSNTSPGGTGAPIKFTSTHVSSPSNGWSGSPDSSDVSSRNNLPSNNGSEKVKRRGRRKKHDIDYKEADEGEDCSNNVPVPKRKRGRPKKNHAVSVITCAPGPNTSGMVNSTTAFSNGGIGTIKTEPCDIPQWDTSTMEENGNTVVTVPVKRGRGRPKKIRSDSGDFSNEDGERQKKKPGRKKRENGMPILRSCEICVLEFENNQDLLAHKRIVHPEKFHKCTICNETYLHAGFLARHMETHTLDRDYRCHLCISSFNTYQLLKGHCLEKHGVDLGRQSDWKRDNELVMSLKMKSQEFRQNDGYGHQSNAGSQSQSLMTSSTSNCGLGNDVGRSDLEIHNNASAHSQHQHQQQHQQQQQQHQQQQQQQQQHSIIRQLPPHNPHQQQLHQQQHHMQQQQNTPPPLPLVVHHPQQLSQHHQHHSPHQQPLPRSHHHHHHHHMADDEDDGDIENSGFPLDFGGGGPDTLPPLFDPSSNEGGMGNYLNSIESDSMQLY